MRIKEIHIYAKDLPIKGGPYIMSTMTLHSIDTTIVKVVTDNGLVGWGEVAPLGPNYQPQHALGARAALAQMAPSLIGESCLQPVLMQRRMNGLLNGHHYAKAAIDMAMWDIMGKHYGVRVCDLLGGAEREVLPAYYALNKGSPEQVAEQAKVKSAMGYKRLQLKCGGRDVAEDIAVIEQVWQAVGNKVKLVVDANRALNGVQTIQLSMACQHIPLVIEQPCHGMDEIAAIRPQLVHPVYLDECVVSMDDVLRAIQLNTANGFGFKITRMGGLTPMQAIRDVCESRHLLHTVDDSWGGDIIAAAQLHMAATVKPEVMEGVWIAGDYIDEHYDPDNGIGSENAQIQLPKGVGLGISPRDERIGQLWQSVG